MEKRIIYKNKEGGVSVIIPSPDCEMTVEQIAQKDVPSGLPFKIIDVSELPKNRDERAAWVVDDADLTDGIGGESHEFG
jgi:hypothetical protein